MYPHVVAPKYNASECQKRGDSRYAVLPTSKQYHAAVTLIIDINHCNTAHGVTHVCVQALDAAGLCFTIGRDVEYGAVL